MKTKLYAITDIKAERTTEPFSCPSDASAKRNFIFGCFASNTPVQDCILWRIADFSVDDEHPETFALLPCPAPVVVNPTIEEIEAYQKLFESLHNPEGMYRDENAFEDFEVKGVI